MMPSVKLIAVVTESITRFNDMNKYVNRMQGTRLVFVRTVEDIKGLTFCAQLNLADYIFIPNYKELLSELQTRIR